MVHHGVVLDKPPDIPCRVIEQRHCCIQLKVGLCGKIGAISGKEQAPRLHRVMGGRPPLIKAPAWTGKETLPHLPLQVRGLR